MGTPEIIDEQALISAAQEDPARFLDLYNRYFYRVWAYVVKRVAHRAEAEDVTSDVFRRALENLRGYEWRGTPFLAWLLKIAANTLAHRWEKAARESGDPMPEVAEQDADLERRAMMFQEELERRIRMRTTATYVRAGYTAITPYLTVEQVDRLIGFIKQVFGAEETYRGSGSAGGTHCELRIGDSMIMCGGGPMIRGQEKPATLHVYVPDTDVVYERALAAGATSIAAPENKPYGARQSSVQDPTGNRWVIATHEGQLDEPQRTVTPFLVPPEGALGLIEFIKTAFGAREMGLYQSEGKLQYAALVVGDAVLEFGEAPGFPKPALLLYVPDADASYRAALAEGAKSLQAPSDQPYGDRMGTIEDVWGNTWYIAQHLGR